MWMSTPFCGIARPDLDTLGKKQYNTYVNLGIIGYEPKETIPTEKI